MAVEVIFQITDAQTDPLKNVRIVVRARGADNTPVYKNGGTVVVGDAAMRTDEDGEAVFSLERNADLLPTTSYYEATFTLNDRPQRILFRVPAIGAGPFTIEDTLIEAPGDVVSSALDAHIDSVGHHRDVDLTGNAIGKVLMWNGTNFVPVDTVATDLEAASLIMVAIEEHVAAEHGLTLGTTIGVFIEDVIPSINYESKWGIDEDGLPYYDEDGAAEGEQAILHIEHFTSDPDGTPVYDDEGILTLTRIGVAE